LHHYPVLTPYIIAGLAIYAFDLVLRVARTRSTTGYVTAYKTLNGCTTHVHLPEITKGWRAGQHVRVRFIDSSSGTFGRLRAYLFARTRPYSISSKPNGSGLELLIKKEGVTTKQIFEHALSTGSIGKDPELGKPSSCRTTVLIEGPYGGPGYTMFESYSGALLVAGGSGVSYILSILEDLVQKHIDGRSRVRTIEIVWSVGNFESLCELLPTLRPLIKSHITPNGAQLNIQMMVHYTRATDNTPPDASILPDAMYLRTGRPDLIRSLRTAVERTINASGRDAHGVIGTCCGPTALAYSLNAAVGQLDYSQWRTVGGVETTSEAFGW
jgi:ferric-chelate reductase